MRLKVLTSVLLVGLCSSLVASDDDAKIAAALEAVNKWAPLMDAGQYEKCWTELAQFPKEKTPKDQWLIYMSTVRKPLGTLKTRKQLNAEYKPSLKAIPDQEGAVIQFESSFEKQAAVVETFGLIREKDGQWRVGFYLTK